jgi:putative hemolysin
MRTKEIATVCVVMLMTAEASAALAQTREMQTLPGGGAGTTVPGIQTIRPGPGTVGTGTMTTGTETTATPLTTNECYGLGGKADVVNQSTCASGEVCHTVDSNKVDHWQCITAKQ